MQEEKEGEEDRGEDLHSNGRAWKRREGIEHPNPSDLSQPGLQQPMCHNGTAIPLTRLVIGAPQTRCSHIAALLFPIKFTERSRRIGGQHHRQSVCSESEDSQSCCMPARRRRSWAQSNLVSCILAVKGCLKNPKFLIMHRSLNHNTNSPPQDTTWEC